MSFYVIVNETTDQCGPMGSFEEAHQKGTMWYGTGNFTITEIPDAPEKSKKAPAKVKEPEPEAE